MNGTFITLEGGEGSGKTSVAKMLKDRLRPELFVFANDPSSQTEELKALRHLALSKGYDFGRQSELMIYGASRTELVEKIIRPALESGKHVICDRFFDSTSVYQGALKGHPPEKLAMMNEHFCGNLVPDKTFLFDVDARTGLVRSNGRLDAENIDEGHWESAGLAVHERINAAYRDLAMANGKRFHILNSNAMSIEQMTDAVERAVAEMKL